MIRRRFTRPLFSALVAVLLLGAVLPNAAEAMQQYVGWIQSRTGAALAGVTVTVKIASSGATATIYSDKAGTTEQTNPLTSAADGRYRFYARNGRYSITYALTGYSFTAADTADILLHDPADERFRVTDYGALCNVKEVSDGVIAQNTAILTSATAAFTSLDVGKLVSVAGAGSGGAHLSTTISSYTSATAVTLAANASTTVSAAYVTWATNDSTALADTFTAATASPTRGFVEFPRGFCGHSTALAISGLSDQRKGITLAGQGRGISGLRSWVASGDAFLIGTAGGLVQRNVHVYGLTWDTAPGAGHTTLFACDFCLDGRIENNAFGGGDSRYERRTLVRLGRAQNVEFEGNEVRCGEVTDCSVGVHITGADDQGGQGALISRNTIKGVVPNFLPITVTDGAMTAASAVLTSATAAFTSSDVGRIVVVAGATAAGNALHSTISAYTSASSVTLADAAGTTVSGATVTFRVTAALLVDPQGSTEHQIRNNMIENSRRAVLLARGTLTVAENSFEGAGDARTVTDAAITAAATTLTSATAVFVAGDVGRYVIINGAGAGGVAAAARPLFTRITTFTNATTVTVADAATYTVSGATATLAGYVQIHIGLPAGNRVGGLTAIRNTMSANSVVNSTLIVAEKYGSITLRDNALISGSGYHVFLGSDNDDRYTYMCSNSFRAQTNVLQLARGGKVIHCPDGSVNTFGVATGVSGDVTPYVAGLHTYISNNSILADPGETVVTNFLHGQPGQAFGFRVGDNNTVIQHNATTIWTKTGQNIKAVSGDILYFVSSLPDSSTGALRWRHVATVPDRDEEATADNLAGDVNDYTCPVTYVTTPVATPSIVCRVTPTTTARTITGIAGGGAGRQDFFIHNLASAITIVFKHQDSGSTAANRIVTPNGSDVVLGGAEVAWFRYDLTSARWRLVLVSGGMGEITDIVQFYPAYIYCRSDVPSASLVIERVAKGDWALSRTAGGPETYNVVCGLPVPTRTDTSKGFKLTEFRISQQITTAALTSNTFNDLSSVVYANNVANAVADYGGVVTVTMPTATQANPYLTSATLGTAAYLNPASTAAPATINLDFTVVMQNLGVYRLYGIEAVWTRQD